MGEFLFDSNSRCGLDEACANFRANDEPVSRGFVKQH